MRCGHEVTVCLFGPEKERRDKIKYFEDCGLCKECYKKKLEEDKKALGLCFNVFIVEMVDYKNGEPLINVYFYGDTMPNKDAIKSLGYKWSEKEGRGYNYDGSLKNSKEKCWNKIIPISSLQEEIEKAASIGAKVPSSIDDIKTRVYYYNYDKMVRWEERKEEINNLKCPDKPSILEKGEWNGNIYGKIGNGAIYINDERIPVTEEQIEELKQYKRDLKEYEDKFNKIKSYFLK